jgi:hypothetical protein
MSKFSKLSLILTMILSSGLAQAERNTNYQPTPADEAKVKALAAKLMGAFASNCPIKPVGDHAAYNTCREALFRTDSVLRTNIKHYILWGRRNADAADKPLKDLGATQFGNDIFSGTYAALWMWDGKYDVEYAPKDKAYRITANAAFRNELAFGQYPYPFWHDAKKWGAYEGANTMTIWIDPKIMKVSQFTFSQRADKPAVVQLTRRHTPGFDGKWLWTDDKGQSQPAPTLFVGLYSAHNPNMGKLDATYRKFALTMRDAECDSCHIPTNPDKSKRLVLLQTPLHAASEIERVLRDVREDRMPLDDSGIENPLKDELKARLLTDAENFAAVVKAAREWEAANPAKGKAEVQKVSAISAKQAGAK